MTIRGTRTTGLEGGAGRCGFILIAVLVVVLLSSMVAISLLFRIRAEQAGAVAGHSGEQAWLAAWSGVQAAMLLAAESHANPAEWRHNPQRLFHQPVFDDGAEQWYFTVYSPPDDPEEGLRHGLRDEGGCLNVNWAAAGMLRTVVGADTAWIRVLTGEVPASGTGPRSAEGPLADVPGFSASPTSPTSPTISPDDAGSTDAGDPGSTDTSPSGPIPERVEILVPRRNPRQLATLEELLTLPGMTPGRLYGEDANRNFALDPNEDDGEETFPPDDADGQLFAGLHPVLTVTSHVRNRDGAGREPIRVNSRSTDWEADGLSSETIAFIHEFQASDILLDHPAELYGLAWKAADTNGVETTFTSPVTIAELDILLDRFTAESEERLEGRINVNTAPAAVLKALPGVDESRAEEIVRVRETLSPETMRTPAWLLREEVLDERTWKSLARWMTTRSGQFRFHVVGYSVPGGRYRTLEVVIDVAGTRPEVLYLRDLTRLGLPFGLPLTPEGQNEDDPRPQIRGNAL